MSNKLNFTYYIGAGASCNVLPLVKQSAENHASIDTFAKKLYIKNEQHNLLRLKATLSCYFLILQGLNNVDQRYDTFFASITNKDENENVILPDNIKIISWNYDIQFEKAFNIYLDNIKYLSTQLQAPPITGGRFEFDYSKFGIIRLNGIADV